MSAFPLVLIGCVIVGGCVGVLFAAWLTGSRLDRDTDDWVNRRGKYARKDSA